MFIESHVLTYFMVRSITKKDKLFSNSFLLLEHPVERERCGARKFTEKWLHSKLPEKEFDSKVLISRQDA